MPIEVSGNLSALTISGEHRFASCWKILRRDGTIIRLTDHDSLLVLPNDGTYQPQNGVEASARQKKEGGPAANFEVRGVLSSDLITPEDLLAGRYREADVTEFMVDWRYPHAGVFRTHQYIIEDTQHDGREWKGSVVGLSSRLRHKKGRKLTRTCDADFGDSRCKVSLAAHTYTGSVVGIFSSRQAFTTSLNHPRAFFNGGRLTWTSGQNNGILCEIKNSLATAGGGRVTLWLKTPLDVEAGNTFSVIRGCPKTYNACVGYANLANFRGFDTMPGNDTLMRTPDAK